jgi:hypothetical protein
MSSAASEAAEKMKSRFSSLGDSAKKKKAQLQQNLNSVRLIKRPSMAEKIGAEGERITFSAEEWNRPAIVRHGETGKNWKRADTIYLSNFLHCFQKWVALCNKWVFS